MTFQLPQIQSLPIKKTFVTIKQILAESFTLLAKKKSSIIQISLAKDELEKQSNLSKMICKLCEQIFIPRG